MTLSINLRPGASAQGGPGIGLMTAAGNPWSLPDALAQELVNRQVATAVNWPNTETFNVTASKDLTGGIRFQVPNHADVSFGSETNSPAFVGAGSALRNTVQLIPQAFNGLQVVGYDATADVIFTAGSYGGGNGNFVEISSASSDTPVAGTPRSLPATWTYAKQCIVFKGNLYLFGATGGLVTVWKTTPTYGSGANYIWSQVFQASTGSNNVIGSGASVSLDGKWLYFGEYGDAVGGPTLWKTGDGATWSAVWGRGAPGFTWPDARRQPRHIHAVAFDPYSDTAGNGMGDMWMTLGDGGVIPQIAKSLDGGVTFVGAIDPIGSNSMYQSVAISFTKNYIYFAADQNYHSVWVYDRAAKKLISGSQSYHGFVPPPLSGARAGGSTFADGVFTSGSAIVTSATAGFTANDVGRYLTGMYGVTPMQGAFIASVQSGTQATLNVNALSTASAQWFQMANDSYDSQAYMSIVDPVTGIFYCISQPQFSNGTTAVRHGILTSGFVGAPLEPYIHMPPNGLAGIVSMAVIAGNFLYWSRWRIPLSGRWA